VELRRNRGVDFDQYKNQPEKVKKILKEDFEKAIDFFERMLIAGLSAVAEKNEESLKALGVAIEVPKQPIPRIRHDEAIKKYGKVDLDAKAGEEVKGQFFWVTGLMRENYDLIYPYVLPDGGKIQLSDFTSDMIYNYDICAKSLLRKTNKFTPALEIVSGALREWLYEPIIQRLLDNRIIPEAPVFEDGMLQNIAVLDGYGPFLTAVHMLNKKGQAYFPDTFGAGIGIERSLYALLKGETIEKIDDVTCFGKNPDTYPIFLF